MKRKIIKVFFYLLPIILSLAIYLLLPFFPWVAEYIFARVIFRIISVPFGFVTSLFPFSLAELGIVLAAPAVAIAVILTVRRCKKSGKKPMKLLLKGGYFILSFALLGYMLLHGANYYRFRAADIMELDASKKTAPYLQSVCIDLAQKASAEREHLSEDENGVTRLSKSLYATLYDANRCYAKIDGKYPFLWGSVWAPKHVFLSPLWSYTGIEGMYCPITCEANINTDIPDFDIPYTAAHELAHTRGFAYEDECNFFAFLACSSSDSADYRYSGYVSAFVYCANALYRYDKDMWKEAYSYCSDGVKRDIIARNDYWKQFEGPVMDTSSKLNDAFIKGQGDKRGTLSYSASVSLILAYYESTGFVTQ